MFRSMRRNKQALSKEECFSLLKNEKRAVLAVNGDDGYPYAIFVNYIFDENENAIYLHGAKEGHKIDSLKKCDKVCFSIHNDGEKIDPNCTLLSGSRAPPAKKASTFSCLVCASSPRSSTSGFQPAIARIRAANIPAGPKPTITGRCAGASPALGTR